MSDSYTAQSHARGRTVLVTGSGGGVGAELDKRLIANGVPVVGTDVPAQALENLSEAIHAGPALKTLAGDIISETDTQRLADLVREPGGLDFLVNCGFPRRGLHQRAGAERRRRNVHELKVTHD